MQVVQLSDHPGDMLQETRQRHAASERREQLRYDQALALHQERVDQVSQVRDQARAEHRWLAWLRCIFAVRRERRQVPAVPVLARPRSDREGVLAAGVKGEQVAEAGLSRALGDEWTLLRGYCNRRGEIDHLLLGPRGLFAIESKYLHAMVGCNGDRWWTVKYDKYGNRVSQPGELADRRGRSPSEQVNQAADQLEAFLHARGHEVDIQRIVLFTHPRSRLGDCISPTVSIATSADQVVGLLNRSAAVAGAAELAELQQLIIGDHRNHAARRSSRKGRG
jgi:hypothetical protein